MAGLGYSVTTLSFGICPSYVKKKIFFRKHCLKYAGIYYGAVRVGGKKHYDVPSKSWCNMCPSYNGDPSLRVPLGRR